MQKQNFALFKSFDHAPQLYDEISSDPFSLNSFFWINRNKSTKIPVTLKNPKHVLQTLYTQLKFDLKFQIIYQGYLQLNNKAVSKKIGFRLRKEQNIVEFQIVDQNQIHIWIQYLSKSLAQYVSQQYLQSLYKPYRKLNKFGTGTFADVYDMYKQIDHNHLAVKTFSKKCNGIPSKQIQRIKLGRENEISIMKALNHPNIVKLQRLHESDNYIYMALQLLNYGHLQNRIQNRIQKKKKFTQYQLKQFMIGMAKVLIYLKKNNIIHRNLSPTNIMMKDKDTMFPVVIDFRLSAYPGFNNKTVQQIGTPGYICPERLQWGAVLQTYDVFSTGAIFYYLLTLKPLFKGSPFQILKENKYFKFDLLHHFHNDIDQKAMELLKKMLRTEAKDRISVDEILKDPYLSDWVQNEIESKSIIPQETISVEKITTATDLKSKD